jgi:hypothetical protein
VKITAGFKVETSVLSNSMSVRILKAGQQLKIVSAAAKPSAADMQASSFAAQNLLLLVALPTFSAYVSGYAKLSAKAMGAALGNSASLRCQLLLVQTDTYYWFKLVKSETCQHFNTQAA